jgi:hypothetical protein
MEEGKLEGISQGWLMEYKRCYVGLIGALQYLGLCSKQTFLDACNEIFYRADRISMQHTSVGKGYGTY